ncbi:hypothetical protein HanRHA438_Chr17g0796921 [Helianthus annuus]|nr:hypothetical protein HanRHA438_Chr17g0796921 [Helianthus annuus]
MGEKCMEQNHQIMGQKCMEPNHHRKLPGNFSEPLLVAVIFASLNVQDLCHTPTNGGNIGMRRSVKIARDIITLIIVTSN